MIKSRMLGAAAVLGALVAFTSPAQAAQTLVITGPSGTFGNDSVLCPAPATATSTCAFNNTFTFVTPVGFNLANATISSSALGGNNIDFTSVLLNGSAFSLTPTGAVEFGSLAPISLVAGATNTLSVNGNNTGDSAFSGTLTFAAVSPVPEPATWGLMLLGFGGMGVSMRRSRRKTRIAQVA